MPQMNDQKGHSLYSDSASPKPGKSGRSIIFVMTQCR